MLHLLEDAAAYRASRHLTLRWEGREQEGQGTQMISRAGVPVGLQATLGEYTSPPWGVLLKTS